MDVFQKDLDLILAYVESAKKKGRIDCVYSGEKLGGQIFKLLTELKMRLPGYKIWYVDPVVVNVLSNEETGIHVQWGLDDK
jgi:hypothetical protein